MKQRLLALASTLAALGVAGGVYFVNWNDGTVDTMPESFGAFEVPRKSDCSPSACNATACLQAANVLADAGSSCSIRFLDCDTRVGARARAQSADAGVALSVAPYQAIRFIAMRCPVSGGFAWAVPVDDAGWPTFSVAMGTPGCARAPVGATTCMRLGAEVDGGARWYGDLNQFPASQATGSGCEPIPCGVFAGDQPN